MASRLHWRELKVGILAAVSITTVVLWILIFADVGALRGDVRTIYVTAPDVSGVLKGTDVWVQGKKVGQVKEVSFRPITSDTLQRVIMRADVLVEALPFIRRDSRADIRPGGNLIGSPIVYIHMGTLSHPGLKPGDTVASHLGGRIQAFGSQIDTLAKDLTAVATSAGKILDKMSDPTNSVGAFRSRGIPQLRASSAIITTYTTRATKGNGTVALALRNDVIGHAQRIFAAKDSIMLLVSSGTGNVGRFRKDSTLLREVSNVRAGIDSLKALTSGGGITKLRSDTTLKAAIARARTQLDSLMIEIKKHPTRYISF
ncbi:MAG TPA: MlaD family protein [Gemmatimonadaceae bacterium]|nr:MlaD family protein [Gemmatimonadaceae bacterium]